MPGTRLWLFGIVKPEQERISFSALQPGKGGAGFFVLIQRSLEILRDRNIFLRSVRCRPATILPGGFDRLEARGLHLTAGDQPFRFLCIDLRPDALRSTGRELLKPVFVVEAFLLSI